MLKQMYYTLLYGNRKGKKGQKHTAARRRGPDLRGRHGRHHLDPTSAAQAVPDENVNVQDNE